MRYSACQCICNAAALIALACAPAQGAVFTETWESPAIAGGSTAPIPVPWFIFPGSAGSAGAYYPTSSDFSQIAPLDNPAGGNQVLHLIGTNTGIYRLSGDLILPNTTYTLTAAIGNDLQSTIRNDSWSLQLWGDANGSGNFEGSGFDVFIGQQFGTNLGAVNPASGQWASNFFSFNSATTSSLVGKQLVVFLNNFNLPNSASYYDNITLTATPDQTAVPEPTSMLLWLGVSATVLFSRSRRRSFPPNAEHGKRRPARQTVPPRFERLDDRLALSGFGPEDGAYFVEPWNGTYEAVKIQSGNQAIVATGPAARATEIARYDAVGDPDASFGSGGRTNISGLSTGTVGAGNLVALQSDGKALVVGATAGLIARENLAVARVSASGSLDSSFGSGGKASVDIQKPRISDTAYAVGQQSSGKIVVAGVSGTSFAIARFTASGVLDSGKNAFGMNVKGKAAGYTLTNIGNNVTNIGFADLAVQPDDKIVAVGSYFTGGTLMDNDRLVVMRYTAAGALDATFNGTGYSVLLPAGFGFTHGTAVELQTDGKIVVAGLCSGIDGRADMLVARFNTNGTLDFSFGGGSGYVRLDVDGSTTTTSEYAYDVLIQPDGKIVAAGWGLGFEATAPGYVLVARLNTDGTPDASFGPSGFKSGLVQPGHRFTGDGVALQTDGSIIVSGSFNAGETGATRQPMLMRFHGNSSSSASTTSSAVVDEALMLLIYDTSPTTGKRK